MAYDETDTWSAAGAALNSHGRQAVGWRTKGFRSAEGATFHCREMAMSALRASGVIDNLFHGLTAVAIQ